MKNKVLYVFALILYLLIVCTFVSQKIENEMCTQVEVSERKSVGHVMASFSASADALFSDEEGQHLYEIVEGSGWSSSNRIQEVPSTMWSRKSSSKISLASGKSYILIESASRMPEEGDKVEIVKVPGRTTNYVPFTDPYLVIYPEGVPVEFVLPETSEIIEESDTALLLHMGDIIYPFFEHRAKQLSDSLDYEKCYVFSMAEIEDFLRQLPKVAVLTVCLVFPVLIWLFSAIMVKEATKYRDIIRVNLGITVVFLLASVVMLGQIDFPASMMPVNNIFDISHYIQEFTMIMEAQSTLKISGQTVEMLLTETKSGIVCIFGVGTIVGIVFSCLWEQ